MEPILTTIMYPALGKTTTYHPSVEEVQFMVYFEARPGAGCDYPPEGEFTALLWWRDTSTNSSWRPTEFKTRIENVTLLMDREEYPEDRMTGRIKSRVGRLHLPVKSGQNIEYCLKYRYGEGPWLWDGARVGGKNGKVIIAGPLALTFDNLLDISSSPKPWIVSRQGEKFIWSLEMSLSPDELKTDGWGPKALGIPLTVENWMSIVKIAAPWMGPQWSSSKHIDLSEREAIMLLYRRQDGNQVCIIPVSGIKGMGNRYIITKNDSPQDGRHIAGQLFIDVRDDGNTEVDIFVGVGGYDIVERVVDSIREKYGITKKKASKITKLLSRDAWRDGLSYCTWNGLGPHLSEEKIMKVLTSLDAEGIKITNLIIDDDWQTNDNRNWIGSGTWSAFQANKAFDQEHGLKGLITRIKKQFPYISNVGVWHALQGYWDGITPKSEIAENYKCNPYLWKDNVRGTERELLLVAPEEIEKLYDDFYSFLQSCGVTCCKTDVQCRIDELTRGEDKKELMPAYQDALKKASDKYLGGKSIYCMSHVPSILFGALLGNHPARKPVVRTSDDFYPSNVQTHSFHVFANSMNQVLFSALDCTPDWDMFQTHDGEHSELHAFARAFSSGAIFLTDAPGKHNAELVSKITAYKPNSTALHTVLADGPARPFDHYHQFDSNHIFELDLTARDGEVKIFGLVNLSRTTARSIYPLYRFTHDKPSVMYSYKFGLLAETRSLYNENSNRSIMVELKPNQFDILTILPIERVFDLQFAVLGLKDKFIGTAAVHSVQCRPMLNGEDFLVDIVMDYLGTLEIFYLSGMKLQKVLIQAEEVVISADFMVENHMGLQIDLLKYWYTFVRPKAQAEYASVSIQLQFTSWPKEIPN